MAKNIAVTASAALPPWLRIAVPVLTAKGSSPTASPVDWNEAALASLPNPSVELTVLPMSDPSEQPARKNAKDRAKIV